jgi:hypothetical protein
MKAESVAPKGRKIRGVQALLFLMLRLFFEFIIKICRKNVKVIAILLQA